MLERNRDDIICKCRRVTLGEILDAKEDGAVTVDMIADKTKATTGCGMCRARIQDILDDK